MLHFNAPLYEALVRHAEKDPLSFHVPGHRLGRGLPDPWQEAFADILRLDVTELSDTDNLHHPEGVIEQAQQLAAACFRADETFFLVGGSTAGNIAMILAVCEPGETIIVQRNVHQSVLHGLMLAGASVVFLAPEEDPATATAVVPALPVVEEALNRYPNAKAVLLTNPNYYGISANLTSYASLAHERGLPLLVDEAHGAHYGHHPSLPSSALSQGADAVVQSAHKTLTAMTMGAMLHVRGNRIARNRLKRALTMVQSSSPSYPIMASLDIARAIIDAFGPSLFASSLEAAERTRRLMATRVPVFDIAHTAPPYRQDPLRLIIRDATGSLSGFRLLRELEKRGCWAEMADSSRVVLLFGIGASHNDSALLLDALSDIAESYGLSETSSITQTKAITTRAQIEPISVPITLSRSLPEESETEAVPLRDAAGRTAAEMVIPYPPGIPVLYPGERITGTAAKLLEQLSAERAVCQGAADPALHTILVYLQR